MKVFGRRIGISSKDKILQFASKNKSWLNYTPIPEALHEEGHNIDAIIASLFIATLLKQTLSQRSARQFNI
jgi:hypothetical protein